jgi:hypothetical protein
MNLRTLVLLTCVLPVIGCSGKVDSPDGTGSSKTALETLQSESGTITSFTFATGSTIPENAPTPPLNITVADATIAQSLYTTTLSEAPFPRGERSCPADFGIQYTLQFFDGTSLVATAIVSPNGCGAINVSSGDILAWDENYFPTLAKALGVDEPKIYPTSPPTVAVGAP